MTSRHQLEILSARLSDRDWRIMRLLKRYRYATTRQLSIAVFDGSPEQRAIPRHVNHALARLRDLGLLPNLERRVGGVRAGSAGHVWALSDLAHKALANRSGDTPGARVRAFEPSPTFLEHTLAVTETAIQLERGGHARQLEPEPECWRTYLNATGMAVRLKPDLAAVTTDGDFEDHWFFEIDRATEPPSRIIRKSLQYQTYRSTGIEQRNVGVFPGVVWIAPNETRRDQLRRHLDADGRIEPTLFAVIVPAELDDLVASGFSNYPGGQKGGNPS